MFPLFIVLRVLFIASMVFIIGYLFGNFSKSKTLSSITKLASILVIVLFITTSLFAFRYYAWHLNGSRQYCGWNSVDSLQQMPTK